MLLQVRLCFSGRVECVVSVYGLSQALRQASGVWQCVVSVYGLSQASRLASGVWQCVVSVYGLSRALRLASGVLVVPVSFPRVWVLQVLSCFTFTCASVKFV